MRLLNDEEVYNAIKSDMTTDIYQKVAKAQQELTNKEWGEWLNEHSSHSGRYRDYLDVTHVGRVVYEEALQARLKEIGNEPQV